MLEDFYIADIWRMIKRWKYFLVLFPIVGIIAAWLLNNYYIKPMYQASATMLMSKTQKVVSIEGLVYETGLAERPLIKTYSEVAKSDGVLQKAIDETGAKITPEALRSNIDTTIVGDDTGILQLSVKNGDPQMASSLANSITRHFIDRAVPLLKVYQIQPLDKAKTPNAPISPNKSLNLFIGAFLGFLFALGLAIFMEIKRHLSKA